jgi:predicted PurR-regulated permease PerM
VVLGLPYLPLVVGTVTVIHMIPFFGPFVSWAPPVLVAILFAPAAVLAAVLIMGISMLLLMNLVQPRLMGDAVGLHPVVVLGSVLVGSKLAGILGAIFAVPVAAVIAAIVLQWRHRLIEAPATIQQMEAAARAAEAAVEEAAAARAAATTTEATTTIISADAAAASPAVRSSRRRLSRGTLPGR